MLPQQQILLDESVLPVEITTKITFFVYFIVNKRIVDCSHYQQQFSLYEITDLLPWLLITHRISYQFVQQVVPETQKED